MLRASQRLGDKDPIALDQGADGGGSFRRRIAGSDGSSGWRSSLATLLILFVLLLQVNQMLLLSSTRQLVQQLLRQTPEAGRGAGAGVGAAASAGAGAEEGEGPSRKDEARRGLGEHRGSGEGVVDREAKGHAQDGRSQLSGGVRGDAANCQEASGQKYVPPVFDTCQLAIVGGRKRDGYGSWPLCLNQVPSNAIVYSVGIGLDASFDAAMMARGAHVFGFDPTIRPQLIPTLFGPRSPEFMSRFTFTQVGLGGGNGVATFLKAKRKGIQSMTALGASETGDTYQNVGFQAAVLTLPALMALHGHHHVDLLKVDVEGIEFYICETPAFLETLSKVGQVIYEFHERLIQNPEGKKDHCIENLKERGFAMVNKTETEEYVFARMRPQGRVFDVR